MITLEQIYAGLSQTFTHYFSEFPASEYTARLFLKCGSAATIIVVLTVNADDGESFDTVVNPAAAGLYYCQYEFTKISTGAVTIRDAGSVEVRQLLSNATEARSWNRQVLDLLKAAMLANAANEFVSVSISGKNVQFKNDKELQDMITDYENLCFNEDIKSTIDLTGGGRLLLQL